MKKRIAAALLALCLALALLPGGGTALAADDGGDGPVPSNNIGANNYSKWAASVKSYLYENGDGGLTRVECVNGKVVVEDYSNVFTYISGTTIEPELPMWGGFFAGEKYNFLIYGQRNPNQDNELEVMRIVKYDKEWKRVDSVGLFGGNTTIPFDETLRCAEHDGTLYIRTAHRMYTTYDGVRHQASMMLLIDEETMGFKVKSTGISNANNPYVYISHSFNQFVLIDQEGRMVVADHGDCYPRAIALYRRFGTGSGGTTIQSFIGAKGNNHTGASFGGLAETANGYVTAYNDNGSGSGANIPRRIYFGYTAKEGLQTETTVLTDEGVAGQTPFLAPTSLEGGYILWNGVGEFRNTLYYAPYSDGGEIDKNTIQEQEDIPLSDCQPIYYNGQVVWYTTTNDVPVFYMLGEDGVAEHRSDMPVCEEHIQGSELKSNKRGSHGYACTVCGMILDPEHCTYGEETETKAPTCSEAGEKVAVCEICGYRKVTRIPMIDHELGEPVETRPTCMADGYFTAVCTECGYEEVSEGKSALGDGHEFERDADGNYVCTKCSEPAPDGVYDVFDAVQDMPVKEIEISNDLMDKTEKEIQDEITEQIKKYLQDNSISYTSCTIQVEIKNISAAKLSYAVTVIACTLDGFDIVLPLGEKTVYLPSDEDTSYISIPSSFDGGEIIPSARYAAPGERVTLTVLPDSGYELAGGISVTDLRGRAVAVRELGGGRYSFAMPDTRVNVDAKFEKVQADAAPGADSPAADEPFTGLGTPGISGIVLNPSPMPFTDVRAGDWFYDSAEYVWKHYLMGGVSDTQFAPDGTTTRAMIWTVLARMNNVRTDVNPGPNWYDRGMAWAMERGVTDGSDPMGNITREQLAAMLWRSAGSPGGAGDLSRFSDGGSVSGYAQGAVSWAVDNGILNGSGGKLDPQGTATRAQVAAMVARYGERVGA